MKTTKTALVITLAVALLATLFGSHRSLNALRRDALAVFEQGEYGDGQGVKSDLERRADVCANLCAVARNNGLGQDERVQTLSRRVEEFRAGALDTDLSAPAGEVMELLDTAPLSDKDRGHLSDFRAELESLQITIRRDPYTQLAQDFNDKTLAAFPANILHTLTGVKPLTVYQ